MKKLLGIIALTALATSLYAQGTVVFANSSAIGPVKAWTSTDNSTLIAVPKSVGTTTINGRVELLAAYNSTTASLTPLFSTDSKGYVTPLFPTLAQYLAANPGWAAYSTTAMGTLQNGAFNGGTVTVGVNDGIGGASPEGAASRFAVLGWTGNFTSYDLAVQAALADPSKSFLGLSPVFSSGTANPLATPPGTAPNLNTIFTGVNLASTPVPEPASFALAGLGIAAMLAFRRRK